MPEFEHIRIREVRQIVTNFVQNYQSFNIPVVLAGDFNAEPMSDSINLMEKHFIDLHVLKTEELAKYTPMSQELSKRE